MLQLLVNPQPKHSNNDTYARVLSSSGRITGHIRLHASHGLELALNYHEREGGEGGGVLSEKYATPPPACEGRPHCRTLQLYFQRFSCHLAVSLHPIRSYVLE
jgi:hypothetical protein